MFDMNVRYKTLRLSNQVCKHTGLLPHGGYLSSKFGSPSLEILELQLFLQHRLQIFKK